MLHFERRASRVREGGMREGGMWEGNMEEGIEVTLEERWSR